MSGGQLYRRVSTRINAVDGVDRESGVRAYCEQTDSVWAIQVRGPMRLRSGREGKDFIVATATLEREQMVALRDAIDRFLAGEDQPDSSDETKRCAGRGDYHVDDGDGHLDHMHCDTCGEDHEDRRTP